MRVAVKPVITTSVALVGASVLAVAPLEPPAPATARVVEQDVSLTASSLAYVPIKKLEAQRFLVHLDTQLDVISQPKVIASSTLKGCTVS